MLCTEYSYGYQLFMTSARRRCPASCKATETGIGNRQQASPLLAGSATVPGSATDGLARVANHASSSFLDLTAGVDVDLLIDNTMDSRNSRTKPFTHPL